MLHAHVTMEVVDCDGRFTYGYIVPINVKEVADDQFGDLTFKHRVISSVVSVHADNATLTVTPERVDWNSDTGEGYDHATIEWCDDQCDYGHSWQRDHRAEAAGY